MLRRRPLPSPGTQIDRRRNPIPTKPHPGRTLLTTKLMAECHVSLSQRTKTDGFTIHGS